MRRGIIPQRPKHRRCDLAPGSARDWCLPGSLIEPARPRRDGFVGRSEMGLRAFAEGTFRFGGGHRRRLPARGGFPIRPVQGVPNGVNPLLLGTTANPRVDLVSCNVSLFTPRCWPAAFEVAMKNLDASADLVGGRCPDEGFRAAVPVLYVRLDRLDEHSEGWRDVNVPRRIVCLVMMAPHDLPL